MDLRSIRLAGEPPCYYRHGPTISDKRVRNESIIAHYEEMRQERVEEMDADVVAWAFLYYLLSTTLLQTTGRGFGAAATIAGPRYDQIEVSIRANRDSSTASASGGALTPRLQIWLSFIGKAEHGPGASFSFILERTGQAAQGMLETHLVSSSRMTPLGCTHVSISSYNEVCQLYEAARLKLPVARLSDEHISRASMAPLASRGREFQYGERVGRGAGRRPVIVEDIEESWSDDSKKTASYVS
ncbi:hypothetical protein JCGZ_10833 [Jatropha curcas]|uniref:Uncharacterized protein n=1 Tax=Jatropha curcas TaxID=180498 RepID=A0A067KT46_JATCU|nr:hypothetical protein JCGZ_10833 [Jatropha curcas]